MAKKFYITTPIYYVNDVPHIGHAYTTIAADVIARYKRLMGFDVFFLTGTDEHGKKVERAAETQGEKPIQHADRMVERFRSLWKKLNISNNDFIRTTEQRHRAGAASIWNNILEKGDIYPGTYEDWYCTPCESYWPDKELINDKCPQCGRNVEKIKEESYFFRMSKYEKPLMKHIEKNPDFIMPASRRNEILSFIRQGLRDISISRTSFSWGIPVPDNPKHVIYVWFDALTNYLTGCGYTEDMDRFNKFWPADVHFIGKDILRFHAVYWPTFLLSAGLPLPKRVFAHGWWTVEGQKMSKSIGNVVDPNKVADEYGVDVLRYFLLREVPFGLDGDFSETAIKGRLTSDLANDLGNLVHRVMGLSERFLNSTTGLPQSTDSKGASLRETAEKSIAGIHKAMDEQAFQNALTSLWELVSAANRYVAEREPWKLAKEKTSDRLSTVIYNSFEAIRLTALMLSPFMPETTEKIRSQIPFAIDGKALEWGGLGHELAVKKSAPLFAKLEKEPIEIKGEKETKKDEGISIEEFRKIDLRIAEIIDAQNVKGSDKLIKLIVDTGNEKKQIVAGIGKSYTPPELIGKRIIIAANLKPALLMGIESQGMVLASGEPDKLSLIVPEKEAVPGSKVK